MNAKRTFTYSTILDPPPEPPYQSHIRKAGRLGANSAIGIGAIALLIVVGVVVAVMGVVTANQPVVGTPHDSRLVTSATSAPDWPPTGFKAASEDLAWQWTPRGTVECKSYQDGCYGITVASLSGCPSGVYAEVAVVDTAGTVIDKANDITAGLSAGDRVKITLSPPGGVPSGARAKLTQLNCLG